MLKTSDEALSIAIASDAETPDVCLEPLEIAVKRVCSHLGRVSLVHTTIEPITLAESHDDWDTISASRFKMPELTADITVMATDRHLLHGSRIACGLAWVVANPDNPIGSRFAAVSLDGSKRPIHTAMHELGHLLNLKYTGANRDGSGHCNDGECGMHAHLSSNSSPDHEITYCSECSRQSRVNASYLGEAKDGAELPHSLIYPPNVVIARNKGTEVTI